MTVKTKFRAYRLSAFIAARNRRQDIYLHSLDSMELLRVFVAFFIKQYNAQMPH